MAVFNDRIRLTDSLVIKKTALAAFFIYLPAWASRIIFTWASASLLYSRNTWVKVTLGNWLTNTFILSKCGINALFFILYSPFSCLTTSWLSIWNSISAGLNFLAASSAWIAAWYSAWLLVVMPR